MTEAEAKREELRVVEGELVEAGLPPADAEDMTAFIARMMNATGRDRQAMLIKYAREMALGMTEAEAQLHFDLGKPPPTAQDMETRKRKVELLAAAVGYKKGAAKWAWDFVQEQMKRA